MRAGSPRQRGRRQLRDDFPRTDRGLWLASLGAAIVMLFARSPTRRACHLRVRGVSSWPAPRWCSPGRAASGTSVSASGSSTASSSPRACVLDVSCGRGIILVEAARRSPNGLAVGVDPWRARTRSGSGRRTRSATHSSRVSTTVPSSPTAEGSALPFAERVRRGVVLPQARPGRRSDAAGSVRELARVLNQGDVLPCSRRSDAAARVALRSADLTEVARSRRVRRVLPPSRYVTATKPT